ncbi:apoptogenic protein 1, partial [Phenoliferia sp. Uapishka_3]
MKRSVAFLSPPRRTNRTPSTPTGSFTLKAPTVDLIGPPCPLSNLRPTYYAALFPSLTRATTTPHPYSLTEFPTSPQSARLARVQLQLHAADLEWRLMRYRIDRHDQDFWTRTNRLFLEKREEFVTRSRRQSGKTGDVDDVELAPFYKEHLDRTRSEYAVYNRELWSMQASLLWPSLKAATRSWRWRWELWKAGEAGKDVGGVGAA